MLKLVSSPPDPAILHDACEDLRLNPGRGRRALGHHVHRHLGLGKHRVPVELGVVGPDPGGQPTVELEVHHPVLELGEDALAARGIFDLEELDLLLVGYVEGDDKVARLLLLLKCEGAGKGEGVVMNLVKLLNRLALGFAKICMVIN